MPKLKDIFAQALERQQEGNFHLAAELYRQILRVNPQQPETYNNLGFALEQQQMIEDAAGCYRQAVRLKPNFPEAWYNLGNVLKQQDHLDEAIRSYREALRHKPTYAKALNNLGIALVQIEKLDEAASCYQHAMRLSPADAEAYCNLGYVFNKQGKLKEAIDCYQQAVSLRPDYAVAFNELGVAFWALRKLDEAVQCCRHAVSLKPDYAEGFNNLGTALWDLDQLDEATQCFREAVRLKPDYVEGHSNLATVLWGLGQVDEALASFEEALRLKPDYAKARCSRALLLLLRGDFERGWPEYEWRWTQPWLARKAWSSLGAADWAAYQRRQNHPDACRRSFVQPLWDGSDLSGRRILLYAEQGLGDTIHFVRYAQLIQERGGKVILECQPALRSLLTDAPGIDVLVPFGETLPAFDVQAPLLSLPGILRTRSDNIPARVPYLRADVKLVDHWRQQLASLSGFKVGIAWQGNPEFFRDRQRSLSLAQFATLARIEGIQLVNLQKGPGTEQVAALAGQLAVHDLGSGLDEAAGAFMDTAAVMMNLDLVITSDTAVAHLAGTMGVPVWLILGVVPDWRWLLQREDCPWYPGMRLFRQTRRGHWQDVFERVAAELRTVSQTSLSA